MHAASNLERIADHAHKIAEIASRCNYTLPEDMREELSSMEALLCTLIDESISNLLQTNSDKANELIDKISEMQRRAQGIAKSSITKDSSEMLVRLVIASSLERMLDYIMNIGELTINLSQATNHSDKI
jgi:phosphate uptake regulator